MDLAEKIERVLCSFACGKDAKGDSRGHLGLGPCDECTNDFWNSSERAAVREAITGLE